MTGRQLDVLRAVHEWQHRQGFPPTVRDLCGLVGVSSPSTVQAHLEALERQQLVERPDASRRFLRLTLLGLSVLNQERTAA